MFDFNVDIPHRLSPLRSSLRERLIFYRNLYLQNERKYARGANGTRLSLTNNVMSRGVAATVRDESETERLREVVSKYRCLIQRVRTLFGRSELRRDG